MDKLMKPGRYCLLMYLLFLEFPTLGLATIVWRSLCVYHMVYEVLLCKTRACSLTSSGHLRLSVLALLCCREKK